MRSKHGFGKPPVERGGRETFKSNSRVKNRTRSKECGVVTIHGVGPQRPDSPRP